MNIIEAIEDPKLFAPWFREPATWSAWVAFLKALFALPMSDTELAVYRECTGREMPPQEPLSEACLIVGRRGGKSFVLALLAVFLAAFKNYRPHLQRGERATVMVIACDRRQARVIMRYVRGLADGVPMLAQMVERAGEEGIDFNNSTTVEVHTASFRSTRGYTLAAALCDELAFWRSEESANPDTEIIAALRPGMATIPGAILLMAGSPYAKRGELYEMFKRHFGKDDAPTLVWKAETQRMNPTIPDRVIAQAIERDEANALAEYGAEFRSDIEEFISREAVELCVVPERRNLPPVAGTHYSAFVDPSGGMRDSMTLAIGHIDGEKRVVDALREVRAPFSPEEAVREFSALLKTYRCGRVVGDRYAGEWPRERFRLQGIRYDPAESPKSDLYRDLLPLITAGQLEMLDDRVAITQLANLERRTARSGRDSIDHPPGGRDDVANVVAGVASLLSRTPIPRKMMKLTGH